MPTLTEILLRELIGTEMPLPAGWAYILRVKSFLHIDDSLELALFNADGLKVDSYNFINSTPPPEASNHRKEQLRNLLARMYTRNNIGVEGNNKQVWRQYYPNLSKGVR